MDFALTDLILFGLVAFLGFTAGRISHIVAHGRNIQSIHHWVYGIVLIVAGGIFFNSDLRLSLIGFGVGLVISDLNDLFKLRFYGVQKFEKQKFWDIK